MRQLCLEDYTQPYEYFLVDEAFNATQIYLEMMDTLNDNNGIPLNESTIVSLNEAFMDNLKNFVITIGKRVAEAIGKFINRIAEIFNQDSKWVNENQATIRQNKVVSGTTIENYYPYNTIDTAIKTVIADDCNQAILEQNKEKWEDEKGYISTNPDLGIPGFTYNNASNDSLQVQIQNYLRGDKVASMDSSQLNADTRGRMLGYCLTAFPSIKTSINGDREKLKRSAEDLEQYIATRRSQNNTPTQTTQVSNAQTTETNTTTAQTTQNVSAKVEESVSYEDTMNMYFNEVDIKEPTKAAAKKQNTETNVNDLKKKDDSKVLAKAVRTYYKVNSKKLSAKMNICVEAYRSHIKLLKWYVKAVNNEQKNTNNNQQNNNPAPVNNTPNRSMADAFC
jgi:hypothetical protein